MTITRREFITALGSTSLLYAFRFVPESEAQAARIEPLPLYGDDPECKATYLSLDYSEWIAFGPDGRVSVFTGRTELGQGLLTVITAIVTQGLEIPQERLTVVMGDTYYCPDDGSTAGSSSTRQVGWGFWLACEKIRKDLVARAARFLRIPSANLRYRSGGVARKGSPDQLVSASDLGKGEAVLMDVDPASPSTEKQYVDLDLVPVYAEKIVTGSLQYVGDLSKPGTLYAGWLIPPYHPRLTKLLSASMDEARTVPGVKMVEVVHGRVAAVADRYSGVLKALTLVKQTWSKPKRPKELPLEDARNKTRLVEVKEQQGDVEAGLASSDVVVSETYTTQYHTHAAIETDTALAKIEGDKTVVWASSQWPHRVRQLTAAYIKSPLQKVRIIGMPVGGGFGGKQANPVNQEAARLARLVGAPVKLIYSRKDQFQIRGNFKAACVVDLSSGVSAEGRMIARKVDIYQDVGDGTKETYDIPHVVVKAYRRNDWPVGIAVTRGTSFVQTCFATESHVDSVAHRLGIDPVDFRRKNIRLPVFKELIDIAAHMIGYDRDDLDIDEGIGLAIIVHGPQFGAVAARVAVDRYSGQVKVQRICGAFDIGTVINRRTATAGIRGAITWGIGYALSEEIILDGHSTKTEYLSQYRIPRFSDIPPMDIVFIDKYNPGSPRGCGEMPAIPTIGAIANAIYNAIGIRFYSIPITPARVKQALEGK